MKTVYTSNTEITKAFNEQRQHFAKANSIYFEGNILYSYGKHYPLAIIQDTYVLINDTGYSPTTGKHIRIAQSYLNNRKQILTSQIDLGQIIQEFEYLNTKLERARKPQIYAKAIQELKQIFDENIAYLGGFYVRYKSMFSGLNFELVKYPNATKEQKEKLDRISKIWFNSLNYTI